MQHGLARQREVKTSSVLDLRPVKPPKPKTRPKLKRFRRSIAATVRVRELLLFNAPMEEIASRVGMPLETFRRLYKAEIDQFGAAGRTSHVPTAHTLKQAETCGMIGLSDADIRRILCISQQTYNESYKEAAEDGRAKGKLAVAREMFRKATKVSDSMPNTTAGIYWSKVHLKWIEAEKLEISGPDGGPIQSQTAVVILPANGRDETIDGGVIDQTKQLPHD